MVNDVSSLDAILRDSHLRAVFQPVLDNHQQCFIGYEALIRGPVGSALEAPNALFTRAEVEDRLNEVEFLAWQTEIQAFAALGLDGLLFLNASTEPLGADESARVLLEALQEFGIAPDRVVLEVTEHAPMGPQWHLNGGLVLLREAGLRVAIDDYGTGYANASLLRRLEPDLIKLDGAFVNDPASRFDIAWLKNMARLAEELSIGVLAEGVESEKALSLVRECGIGYAQGYWIARPSENPPRAPVATSAESPPVIPNAEAAGDLVMIPRSQHPSVHLIAAMTPPLTAAILNNEVADRFEQDSELMLLPIVDEQQRPVGLIERYHFLEGYGQRYGRDLYGKRSCAHFMQPLEFTADEHESIQASAARVARGMQKKNVPGIIVTRNQAYLGVVPLARLMGVISEMQLEAARYANPLTSLPGNVPINDHIDLLLESRTPFTACYVDIDQFKPFNDQYGYSAGDDLIIALAEALGAGWSSSGDFVGHIGGDDFFVLFQRATGLSGVPALQQRFDEAVRRLSLPEHVNAGGYTGENRRGQELFHALPTLSMGAVRANPDRFSSHRELSEWLARAKKMAKKETGHSVFVERRQPHQGC